MNPYFNLAEEKWIRVLETDGSVKEATILDALSRASEYRGLAGETSTQDVAMLRFLMAVLYVSLFNAGRRAERVVRTVGCKTFSRRTYRGVSDSMAREILAIP